jgi:hypothetical protein
MDELLGAGEIAREYKKIESILNQRKAASSKKIELRPLSGSRKEIYPENNQANNNPATGIDNNFGSSVINNSLQESLDKYSK